MPLWELGKQAGLCKQTMWLPGNLGVCFSPVLVYFIRFRDWERLLWAKVASV